MLIGDSEQYLKVAFDTEAELEQFVQDNYELLFGSASIYVPQQRITTSGGKATIPDAVVVDLESGRWYVVEVELARHGTWEHIAPQVSKQLAAVSNAATQESIVTEALAAVRESEDLKEALSEFGIKEFGLHGRIAEILKSLPTVAIPIDKIPDDLEEWAETSFGGGKALRRVMTAGLLSPGQQLSMEYGPKGKPKQTFYATVREDGLEIDGKVYSPSYAATYCMRKIGSSRKTANGWVHWRTEDGKFINELFKMATPEE